MFNRTFMQTALYTKIYFYNKKKKYFELYKNKNERKFTFFNNQITNKIRNYVIQSEVLLSFSSLISQKRSTLL